MPIRWQPAAPTTLSRNPPTAPKIRVQPGTEYDYRFEDIGAFVAERDPERIALNYMQELGPRIGGRSRDGLSHTDYMLLADELGETHASRLVSHEYLMHDYISRTTPAELEMLTDIRRYVRAVQERDWCRIVPGVTRFSDLDSVLWIVTKDGDRIGFREEIYPGGFSSEDDYVIQKGDTNLLSDTIYFRTELDVRDVYGNYYDGNWMKWAMCSTTGKPNRRRKSRMLGTPPCWSTTSRNGTSASAVRARKSLRDIVEDVERAGIMVIDSQVFDENFPDEYAGQY